MKYKRGEVATIITIGVLAVLGVSTLFTSLLLQNNRNKLLTASRAATGNTCASFGQGVTQSLGVSWNVNCNSNCKLSDNDYHIGYGSDQCASSNGGNREKYWCYYFEDTAGNADTPGRCLSLKEGANPTPLPSPTPITSTDPKNVGLEQCNNLNPARDLDQKYNTAGYHWEKYCTKTCTVNADCKLGTEDWCYGFTGQGRCLTKVKDATPTSATTGTPTPTRTPTPTPKVTTTTSPTPQNTCIRNGKQYQSGNQYCSGNTVQECTYVSGAARYEWAPKTGCSLNGTTCKETSETLASCVASATPTSVPQNVCVASSCTEAPNAPLSGLYKKGSSFYSDASCTTTISNEKSFCDSIKRKITFGIKISVSGINPADFTKSNLFITKIKGQTILTETTVSTSEFGKRKDIVIETDHVDYFDNQAFRAYFCYQTAAIPYTCVSTTDLGYPSAYQLVQYGDINLILTK
ncbi:hypothetical protein HGA88_06520 [Candidatus Roizmanbacteria bacterium]|nr:hypothetical protein [Candidatus Roizmanbacteria bacterium]